MSVYLIRRGTVRGEGDYCGGYWSDLQRDGFRFDRNEARRYMASMVGGDYRAVRLLPPGTLKARRRFAAKVLREHAARIGAFDEAGILAFGLERHARELSR